jgi:hypothetical protein
MHATDLKFAVREMRAAEVAIIREWATAEGWNPGCHDGPTFFATDPAGFFVGELDGKPVACISCVAYDDSFGFLGQYIVKPEFRGRGFGVEVWRAGMAHLGTRNVGLDGVLDQQANYARSGFAFAHQHIRYRGMGTGRSAAGIVRLDAVSLADVLDYDRECFPAPREMFLHGWLALPESAALGLVREGRLAGFGVLRASADGFKVGPLFADDLTAADAILGALVAETGDKPFCLDIPDATENAAATELVNRFGMTEVFRTARMYTRGRPRTTATRVFGITTMELG